MGGIAHIFLAVFVLLILHFCFFLEIGYRLPVAHSSGVRHIDGRLCFERARLYKMLKNACFVTGHDFSRAIKTARIDVGFSPCGDNTTLSRKTP